MAGFGLYQERNDKNAVLKAANWIVDIIAIAALAIFVVSTFGSTMAVSGRSMEDTLSAGDRVVLNELPEVLSPIRRFDVICFTPENGAERRSIKRVIGLPGETVQIRGGKILIDGAELEDPYTENISISGLAEEPITLGADEYFVLGDNGSSSEDSRFVNVGNVSRDRIIGKVWFCYSPLAHFGPVH